MNRQLQIHMLTLCLLVLLTASCKQDDCGSPAEYSSEPGLRILSGMY